MTPALHAPHRRRRALLSAIALVTTTAATLPAAGVAAAPSPTRLTIGALPASPALGLLPQIDALGSHVIAVAPAAGLTDEASVTPSTGTLWFSRLDDRPTNLGLAGVPAWAQPHLGTDARGRAVAVYPRCATDAIDSCELYVWDVAAHTERPVDEVNRPSVGELEGTMHRGAVAWTVAPAGQASGAASGPGLGRTLMYRAAGGAISRLSGRGGRRLALGGGRVAQVVVNGDQETSRVELITIRDRARRTLARVSGGAGPRWPVGLRFVGRELRFAVASLDSARLYRVPLARPGAARSVAADQPFTSGAFARANQFVWIGGSAGERTAPLLTDRTPKRLR